MDRLIAADPADDDGWARAVALLGSSGVGPTGPASAARSPVGLGWVPAAPEGLRPRPKADLEPGTGADGGHEPAATRHQGTSRGPSRRPGRHRAVPDRAGTLGASLREWRHRVRLGAVVAVLALVGSGAVVFAVRVAAAQRAAEPVAVGPRSALQSRTTTAAAFGSSATPGSMGSAGPSGTGALPGSSAGASATGRIIVHVVGEVSRPGIVLLPVGARVTDAVDAAGGALPSGQLERVNLARVVADGEQVHVPAAGEPLLPGGVGATGPLAAPTAPAVVDLNRADLAQLDSLPGVGPVLAQRILDWRRAHGRFTSVDELGEVSGIGEQLLRQLAPRVTV